MFDVNQLARKNIRELQPYSSARNEYTGEAEILLDANENPYNTAFNRYPDPEQRQLKQKISRLKGIGEENLFLGNGSDEAIDLLIRIFCEPGKDNMIGIDPSYGMYKVAADIHGVTYRKAPLSENFELVPEHVFSQVDAHTKLIFLCSPNNPSGNLLDRIAITQIINQFQGIVVLDEAYIDFSTEKSFVKELAFFPNLVVLQTFSKAWGLAGIRLGLAIASSAIIRLMTNVKYPYNVNILTQQAALKELDNQEEKEHWVRIIRKEREKLREDLGNLQWVKKIYPSDANFLLVKFVHARKIFEYLKAKRIIVRDRSNVLYGEDCLRITIGSEEENDRLLECLKEYNG